MMNCRGMGAARKPKTKKYAAGGAVEAPPSPTLGQRLRKMVGLETQGEKVVKRKTKLEQAEQDALK